MAGTMALYNVLLLLPSVLAHMELSWPYPLHSKFDPANSYNNIDWSMTSPLEADGSDFPCKGYQNGPMHTTAIYTPGQQYNVSLAGSAPHMGGSCQISLSYDHGATFRVIKSMIGGCPLTHDYDFTIPSFAPPGAALLAWTWQNSEGNREFYMNCAAVQVEAGPDSPPSSAERRRQAKRRGDSFNTFEDLPFIWKANLPSVSNCTTTEKETPVYPEPGPDVQYADGMTKESIVSPGDCAQSQPYGRTYKATTPDSTPDVPSHRVDLKKRRSLMPMKRTNSSELVAPAPVADAAASITPAPTAEQKSGLLGSLGEMGSGLNSFLGLGNGLFTSRSVHTQYTLTGDSTLNAAQLATLSSIESEASAIMSMVNPLLSLREVEMTAAGEMTQATDMATKTDAAMPTMMTSMTEAQKTSMTGTAKTTMMTSMMTSMTDAEKTSMTTSMVTSMTSMTDSEKTSMITSMTDAKMTTMMTVVTTMTLTVTAPGSTMTSTGLDGLLGGILGTGILRRDTAAQVSPTVIRGGLLGPLLGGMESMVLPNPAIDTTILYSPQATQNGGIDPQIGGLGSILLRAVDVTAATATTPATSAMSAATTTSIPIPLIAEPLLGLASILVRQETPTTAVDAQITPPASNERNILSGAGLGGLNDLGDINLNNFIPDNLLKRNTEATQATTSMPAPTASSKDLLGSIMSMLGIKYNDGLRIGNSYPVSSKKGMQAVPAQATTPVQKADGVASATATATPSATTVTQGRRSIQHQPDREHIRGRLRYAHVHKVINV